MQRATVHLCVLLGYSCPFPFKIESLSRMYTCTSMLHNITDIAYQQIKGNYYWAQYGDFKVIMDRSNGYINATKLCQLASTKEGKPKQFGMWKQNIWSGELIKAVSESCGIPQDSLLIEHKVSNELKGIYAHYSLVPHIASWASPVFAVKVSVIVNYEIIRKHRDEIRAKDTKIDDLQHTLGEIKQQNDRITQQNDIQSAKIDEQTRQINELLTEARTSRAETQAARVEVKQVNEQLADITADVEDLSINNAELKTEVHSIAVRLDKATDDRVPKLADDKRNEVLIVYHKPGTNQYKVARRQKKSLKESDKYYADQQFTRRIYCSDSPNAVSLCLLFAKILPLNIGRVYKCTVTLNQGKTTKDLVDFIRKAEAEKKNI